MLAESAVLVFPGVQCVFSKGSNRRKISLPAVLAACVRTGGVLESQQMAAGARDEKEVTEEIAGSSVLWWLYPWMYLSVSFPTHTLL